MMTRQERAKQFMPFDAMKGLQEALRHKEELHNRVEKRILSEESYEKNSAILARLQSGTKIIIEYYFQFHDIIKTGIIRKIDIPHRFLILEEEKIFFDDIYSLQITEK